MPSRWKRKPEKPLPLIERPASAPASPSATHDKGNSRSLAELAKTLKGEVAAVAGQGDLPTNRSPSSSHRGGCGGVDKLDVTCWLKWSSREFTVLGSELNRTRDLAIVKQRHKVRPYYETEEGDKLTVSPSGGKAGGLMFSWRLQSDQGITIQLQDRAEARSGMANCHISIGAVALLNLGHEGAWSVAHALLEQLGAEVIKASCSRIDLAADLLEVDTGLHTRALMNGQYICRGQKGQRFAELKSHPLDDSGEAVYFTRDKFTGFRIGKGDVILRLYDKTEELSNNADKFKLMCEKRWGKIPQQAARAEFQLRHNFLKRFNATSLEQTFHVLPEIAEYLPTKWYVQTDRVPDRKNKHQSRAKAAASWCMVVDAFKEWAGEPRPKLPALDRELSSTAKLETGMLGYLAAIAARRHDVDQWDAESLMLSILHEVAASNPEAVKKFKAIASEKRQDLISEGFGPQLGEFNTSPIGDV